MLRIDEQTLPEALAALARLDPDCARALDEVGPPPLRYRPPGFATLLRVIVAQQVSLASAAAIWARLEAACDPLVPERILEQSEEALRAVGLSRQKARYARSLAETMRAGQLNVAALEALDDEAAIAAVTAVKGLGRWSAEVYLLFSLGRPDVWPADDVGLMMGAQKLKRLPERPDARAMRSLAEPWRPWRAVAARLLWHYRTHGGPAAATDAPAAQPDILP
jgi:DNA-3-methyladenine glycosylase II